MSACIVDASVAIKWVVAEQGTTEALALLRGTLIAPDLLQTECANILWKKVKRGELSAAESNIAVRVLAGFDVEFCSSKLQLPRVLELALALDHPAYDCVYLALAEARGVPLISADERLIRAVRSAAQSSKDMDGISVLPLLSQQAVN